MSESKPMAPNVFVNGVRRDNMVPGSLGAMYVEDIKAAAVSDGPGHPSIPSFEYARNICGNNGWTNPPELTASAGFFTEEARSVLARQLPDYGCHP